MMASLNRKDLLEIGASLLCAWVFYQMLIFVTGTPMPLVSVVSESMEPVLHRGDMLFILPAEKPAVDDIVIYQRPGTSKTIIHRIIEVREGGYIIKGDNNGCPDTVEGTCPGTPLVVEKEWILGKAVFAFPLIGYPRLALYLVGI